MAPEGAGRSRAIAADVRVVRDVPWVEEDGRVVLLVPRFGRGRIGGLLARLFGRAPIRVRLDELGSRTWRLLEEGTTVSALLETLDPAPESPDEWEGDRGDDLADRLDRFLLQLHRARWVRLLRESSKG